MTSTLPIPLPPESPGPRADRPLWSTWLLGALFAGVFAILAVETVVVAVLMGYAVLLVRDGRAVQADVRPVERMQTGPLYEDGPDDAVVGEVSTLDLDDARLDVWNQHGPLTIALLGLDHDTCAAGNDPHRRADTIILVRVNPELARAAMLSLPRDLFVHIDGYSDGKKLAMAHYLGDLTDFEPGAGPGMVKKVVRDNLGIPVHRYARIDFEGFKRIIDAVGPLTIDVPADPEDPTVGLLDTRYPDGACGVMTVEFPPGEQEMNGEQALQYARSRYSTSDFDRSRRQTQVLEALRARATSVGTVLDLHRLIPALRDTVDTDMSAVEILSLVRVARRMDSGDVIRMAMDENYVYDDEVFVDGVPQWILRHFPGPWSLLRERFLNIVPAAPTPGAETGADATPSAEATAP